MEQRKSGAEHFAKANEAFVSEDYARAVELYTEAISNDDTCCEYFSSRAHAHLKLEKFEESKKDAARAVELKPQDSVALLRLGVACFNLEQYEEALEAFRKGASENEPGIRQWVTWTEEKLAKTGRKVEAAVPPKPLAIKHDWYQTESHVCVTILAKNVDPSGVRVDFASSKVDLSAVLPDGTEYKLNLKPSYPIAPEQSSFQVMKTKIELKMKKVDGIRWTQLEGAAPALKQIVPPSEPVYPSSATRKKDWDKIESQLKKEEAEEKPEGEAALNQLFQQIYSGGSDEIRRAMNKSFQESGGTVLSTNWNEVSKEKVTVKPPDGMEYKKWD